MVAAPAGVPREDDDLALLRRQVGIAARSLVRPGTYFGTVRELALTAVHVAAYPLGVARDELQRATEYRPILERGVPSTDDVTGHMPVILVHGYVHNRSAFLAMARALRRAGFRHVHGFDYNPIVHDIPEIAGMLAAEVERVLAVTGQQRCMLVGHSMGGLVARYYVQLLGGEDTVDTVVTLGTPHRGTYTAYLGVGRAVEQLRPGGPLLRRLEETARPSDVRWIAYYTDLDALIVPAASGKLVHPALQATNCKTPNTGHLSLLLSGTVLRGVVEHLANRAALRPRRVAEVATLPSPVQRVRRAARRQPVAAVPRTPAADVGGDG